MKKLSVLFSILFVSAFTFGQNTSVVNETGTSQYAKVKQTGSFNGSTIDQSNASNQAFVTQIGSIENIKITSDIDQTGVANKAETVQTTDGTNNPPPANAVGDIKAIINQSGNSNRAFQNQGPHQFEGNSSVTILQSGSSNYASQNQVRYMNEALINQSGSFNIAEQAQDIGLTNEEPGSMNKANISQSGNSNQSYQQQNGDANLLVAEQSGSFNLSDQNQMNRSLKSSGNVNQSGNSNKSYQSQIGALNLAVIAQSSSLNYANQNQTETGIALRTVSADYAPYNDATIIQMGDNENYATQTQISPGKGGANHSDVNLAYVLQNGYQNVSTQSQSGGYNSSIETQTGNFNHIEVTQVRP